MDFQKELCTKQEVNALLEERKTLLEERKTLLEQMSTALEEMSIIIEQSGAILEEMITTFEECEDRNKSPKEIEAENIKQEEREEPADNINT